MTTHDYLYVCVQAGVALSGFAALAIALRSRADREHTDYERRVVASMTPTRIATCVPAPPTRRRRSAAIVIYAMSVVVRSAIAQRHPEAGRVAGRHVVLVLFVLGTPVMLAPLFNVVPLGISQGPHWYLLAVTWLLSSAGYIFWFLVRAWVRAA